MNNFEKRKFLDYIEKLLPYTDTNDYNFDNVFDFFCDEFKVDRKPYPIDKDNCLNVDTRKKQERFAKLLKKEVIKLKEKIKPQNTLLEKQLLTIKKIYRLNNDEYEMLLYLALKEFNKVFKKYFDCLYENSFATFTRVYLNMRYNRKDMGKLLKSYTNLQDVGKSLYRYGALMDNNYFANAQEEKDDIENTVLKGGIVYCHYVWHSEKGEHTCDECRELDGQVFEYYDEVPERPHPNCRCTVEIVEGEIETDGEEPQEGKDKIPPRVPTP